MRLLLVGLVALVVIGTASASERRPTLSELEPELVCPTCETTLDQSNAPIARRMKQFIVARIAAGDTKSEIKAKLVAQFGPAVLAEPPKKGFDLLAWVLPLAGLCGGAALLGAAAWRWSRGRDQSAAAAPEAATRLAPELERRLDAELRAFDA